MSLLARLLSCISRQFSGREEPQVRRAELQFVSDHPELDQEGTRVLGYESGTVIVAVFYQDPRFLTIPERYAVYVVTGDQASELEVGPDSPYWIPDRK